MVSIKNFLVENFFFEQKKFKNDTFSDFENKKRKTNFEEMMDSFDQINIPVLIFFVPSLYQGFDNAKLTNQLIENQQKTIASMEEQLKEQNKIIKEQDKKQLEMQKKQDEMKEMQKKQDEMEKKMQKMMDEMKKELLTQKIMMEKEKEEYMKSLKEKELINQKK